MKLYRASCGFPIPSKLYPTTHTSPGTQSLASTNIALLELGTSALRKDLVSTHALRTRGYRDPGDGKLLGAHADLLSIRRADGLAG